MLLSDNLFLYKFNDTSDGKGEDEVDNTTNEVDWEVLISHLHGHSHDEI